MIDSARRTVTELGLRHARLEVEQFAGIVELIADDPAAAEPHLRKAYNGFRRMGLDADTAETAALLGRTCLALNRDDEADELCTESERLAGHALKASIAWRTLRAQLLSRRGDHDEARRVAEAAVALAERTDALVDHGDACLTLATVLSAAGDTIGARAAAERAADLYERKGAGALVDKARIILGRGDNADSQAPVPEVPDTKLVNECTRVGESLVAAVNREDWDGVEQLFASRVSVESRRKIVGFSTIDIPAGQWPHEMRRYLKAGMVRFRHEFVAVRGERLALVRLEAATADSSPGAPQDEMLQVIGLDDEGQIVRQVWFDVADIDDAMAELDAAYAGLQGTQPRERRLENAASRVTERFWKHFVDSDLSATKELLADDFYNEDHRRVINSGVRRGRDAVLEDMRVSAAFRTQIIPTTIATRGKQLSLSRARFSGQDPDREGFVIDTLHVFEIDAEERITALITFDPDDIDAAFEELEARYLAGEAAAHAHTWSLIARAFDALNRHELGEVLATTPDYHIVDHRLQATIPADDLTALFRATWDLTPDLHLYVEAVHRLDDLGVVIAQASYGTSEEGFDAQWRMVQLHTVEGDLGNKCEIFDEADLDTALARFDELNAPPRILENAATRVAARYAAAFANRDWVAVEDQLSQEFCIEDRRAVVNAEMRHGREAEMKDLQAAAGVGFAASASVTLATRGEHLFLARARFSSRDEGHAFENEFVTVVEIDANERMAAVVVFDTNDIDASLAELDARYLAGEAAAHANTWSTITEARAAFNRHELPTITPDFLDHRSLEKIDLGHPTAKVNTAREFMPDLRIYIEAVHQLTDLGAVFTQAVHGTSRVGFEAEWRVIELEKVEGDRVSHAEVYDEADLEAALTRFEELHPSDRRLDNAANRLVQRYLAHFATRDWHAMSEMLADDVLTDDRRHVVSEGIRRGRDVEIANVKFIADAGAANITSTPIATRGEHLVLARPDSSVRDWPGAFHNRMIEVVEINADNQISAHVMFDVDDIDAAFEELDARYVAGEAAPYAHTWSVITRGYDAFNRQELPLTTSDFVDIDHRKGAAFAPGELMQYRRAGWELNREIRSYVESVHRLNNLGAVVTQVARLTSQEGFDAEWRSVDLVMSDGDALSRSEIFDETEIDTAIAKFEKLSQPTRRLENAATRWLEHYLPHFAARDWAAMAEMLADDICQDDRRRVVNAGVVRGRDVEIASLRAIAEAGVEKMTSTTIATRGERLLLHRVSFFAPNWPDEFNHGVIEVVEISEDGKASVHVVFDPDDIDAAFVELEARYLAGEAAAHAHTWSLISREWAALNRGEIPPRTQDWVHVDHRLRATIDTQNLNGFLRVAWDQTPDLSNYVVAVHRLSDLGAVVTNASLWDLSRRLQGRVADDRTAHGRGRSDQSLRAIRRSGPRRCACPVRRAQSTIAAADKRSGSSSRALSGIPRGPRLGRHCRDHGRRHVI